MAQASGALPRKHTGRARTCVALTMARTRAGHAQTDTRPAGRAGSEGDARRRPARRGDAAGGRPRRMFVQPPTRTYMQFVGNNTKFRIIVTFD